MWQFLAAYFVIGVIVACWVAVARSKVKDPGLNPLVFVAEGPWGWLLFLLWPLGLVVMWLDRETAKDEVVAPQEHVSGALIGRTGVVVMEFRPVRVEGKLYDAVSSDRSLPAGAMIKVVGQRLGELVVEKQTS